MIEIIFSDEDLGRLRRALLLCAGAVLALYLAYIVRAIWLPLLIAFVIALALDPMVDRMEGRGWSRFTGALLIFGLFFIVTGTVLTFALPAVINQTMEVMASIGKYLPSESESETKQALQRLLNRLHATPFIENTIMSASAQISQAVARAGTWIGTVASGMAANLIWAIIIPIVAFYFLRDFHLILARLLMLVPRRHRDEAHWMVNEMASIFVCYLRGLVIVCSINAVVTTAILLALRVPNAIALGAIAGVLTLVPFVGAILTLALIGGIALISGLPSHTVVTVMAFVFLWQNVILDYLVTPRIVGKEVGLHPVLSLVALLVGGTLLGFLGVVLAVPFAATLQMTLLTLFPKLAQPITVPAGEAMHARAEQLTELTGAEAACSAEEAQDKADVHQTIVEAVDTAEEEGRESGALPAEDGQGAEAARRPAVSSG